MLDFGFRVRVLLLSATDSSSRCVGTLTSDVFVGTGLGGNISVGTLKPTLCSLERGVGGGGGGGNISVGTLRADVVFVGTGVGGREGQHFCGYTESRRCVRWNGGWRRRRGGGQHFCGYAKSRRCIRWNGGWRRGGGGTTFLWVRCFPMLCSLERGLEGWGLVGGNISVGTLRADVVFVGTGVEGVWCGGGGGGGGDNISVGTLRADVVFVATEVAGIFMDRETDPEEMFRGTLRGENVKF